MRDQSEGFLPSRAFSFTGLPMAIQFDVILEDRPGELGKLAMSLSERSINIEAIGGVTSGGKGFVAFLTNQDAATRQALTAAKYEYVEKTVLNVRIEDRPGTLGELARRLGDAGINITSVVQISKSGGYVDLAVGVDDIAKARSIV